MDGTRLIRGVNLGTSHSLVPQFRRCTPADQQLKHVHTVLAGAHHQRARFLLKQWRGIVRAYEKKSKSSPRVLGAHVRCHTPTLSA